MQGALEPCAHHTIELRCRSRLGAACQARAACHQLELQCGGGGAAALSAKRGGRRCGCGAGAGRPGEMQGAAETCAHHTVSSCGAGRGWAPRLER